MVGPIASHVLLVLPPLASCHPRAGVAVQRVRYTKLSVSTVETPANFSLNFLPPLPRPPLLLSPSNKVDADTLVPYCIVGAPPSAFSGSSVRFFNLVVCHDLFDNYERMKIVVAPVIARYPGAQVSQK